MYRFVVCILYALLGYVLVLHAKDYPMLHYTIEDGLPSNTVYSVYEAPDRKLWIGTDKGLSVFDGIRFKNYTTKDGLSDNECFHFYRDTLGRLWIGTFNGELCYYQDGKFHNAQNTPWLKRPFRAADTRLFQSNADGSFLAFYREIGFLEINGEHIRPFYYPAPGLNNIYVQRVNKNDYRINTFRASRDPKYHKYVDATYKIVHIDSNSKVLYEEAGPPAYGLKTLNKKGSIVHITEEIDHNIFRALAGTPVYTELKSILVNGETNQIFDNGECILVSNSKGLLKDNKEWLLYGKNVHGVYQDRRMNYWVGTAKHGLYRLPQHAWYAKQIIEAYTSAPIYACSKAPYLLWGTEDGLVHRAKKMEEQIMVDIPDDLPQEQSRLFTNLLVDDNYYVFADPGSYVIRNISTTHSFFAERLREDVVIPSSDQFLTDSFVFFCMRSFIIVVLRSDLVANKGKVYKTAPLSERNSLYAFAVSPDQHLWYSTVDQIYRLEDTTPVAQLQFGKVAFRESLFVGDYYVGISHTNQLLVCRDYERAAIHVDTVQSFRDCVWDKLYKVNDSTVLLSTNNYFRLLHLPTRSDSSCHLRVVENPFIPYQPDYVHLDSSDCYFFKGGDITRYPLSALLAPEALPHVVFDRLYTLADTLQIGDTLSLSYDRAQNLKISFSPVSFDHKELTYEYAFCHPGESLRWQSLESEELSVLRMGYGVFEVHVRALTLSGDYSEDSHFVLIVSRPFWARWWFIGLLTLLFLFLVVYVARLGIKRNLRRKEQEVRFLRSEYKALNALMNPHFIFNSLNSLQSLVHNNENTTASRYIRTFSDLIRQNMSNVSQELISLSKEIVLVENYLKIEQLRFKEKLSYRIAVEESVEADLIMIPPLLIQPMVENAIKHGVLPKRSMDGFISIQVYEESGLLYISIRDNGQGLREGGKDSYALGNIRKRIAHLEQIHSIRIEVRIENLLDEDGEVSGVLSLIIIEGV